MLPPSEPRYPEERGNRGAGQAPGGPRPRLAQGARRDDGRGASLTGGGTGIFAAVGGRLAGLASSRDTSDFRPRPARRADQTTMQYLMAEIRSALELRSWVLKVGVPILAMIPVGIAVVIVVGANSGTQTPTPSATGVGFPPANVAAADFTTAPAQEGRGLSQTFAQVASDANGNEIVAVGAQTGANVPRARFLVSENAGRSWQLGTETGPGGGNPPPGHAPTFVAGGQNGWVAVGPDSVWTSTDGVKWTLQSATGLPVQAGDKINVLTRTANGFLAAGQNTTNGTTTPVVWLSENGVAWQRLGAASLGLKGAKTIRLAAAAQNSIVIAGAVTGGGDGVWRSVNGTAWTPVTVPAAGGAENTIDGIAPLFGGFVAVRPAVIGGVTGALVYTSPNGTTWTQSPHPIQTADNAPLKLGPVTGTTKGAAIVGEADGFLITFISADGINWTGSDPFGTAAQETFTSVALTSGNIAVTTATRAGDARRTPVITLIGGQGQPRNINVNAIPGAVQHQLAFNAAAAAGGTLVAAGSADGFPALYASTDGGTTWTRGTGAALNRPGVQQVASVAHGPAGWVAVGGVTAAAQAHPVVVTSATGAAWTQADNEPAFAGAGLTATGVAAGQGGYAIVGTQSAGRQTTAVAWFSAGLTGWQRVTPGGPGTQMTAVAATTGGFAAVGSNGAAPAAWFSPNGRGWLSRPLPLPKGAVRAVLQFVAASGNKVVAVGTEVTGAGQEVPFAAESADGGSHWTESAIPVPRGSGTVTATVTALAASGDTFMAAGAFGTSPGTQDVVIWTLSPGGTAWTSATPQGRGLTGPGIQEITALTTAGSTLTGIGFQATATDEQPIIWQSPIRG